MFSYTWECFGHSVCGHCVFSAEKFQLIIATNQCNPNLLTSIRWAMKCSKPIGFYGNAIYTMPHAPCPMPILLQYDFDQLFNKFYLFIYSLTLVTIIAIAFDPIFFPHYIAYYPISDAYFVCIKCMLNAQCVSW